MGGKKAFFTSLLTSKSASRADVLLQSHCVHTPLEIHELHNIYVNLYADINREFPDELYIVNATHRRQMSKINVQSKV